MSSMLVRDRCCSLVSADVLGQEEFCFPVESLALTVEEVMHIRQVLVKAELEKFQQYKDIYNAMKKGKVRTACIIWRRSMSTKQAMQSYRWKRSNAWNKQ